jgi:hypothetical protein
MEKTVEQLLEPIELDEAELAAVAGGNNVNVGVVIGMANGAFSEQENTIAQVNAVVATNFLNG